MNKYVISDIHGCLKTFKKILKTVSFSKKDELYILGDLIDRGPDSKGVIDFIWQLQEEGFNVFCTRGNHDQMMLDAQQSLQWQRNWLMNGGWSTLESFNAATISDIPSKYFHFIDELPHYLEVDDYILVHAGFKFDMPNPFEELHSMLWQRNWYELINYHWLRNRTIVHGHTPTSKENVNTLLQNLNKNQYLNIDAGCVHKGKRPGLGWLACFELNSQQVVFVECEDI